MFMADIYNQNVIHRNGSCMMVLEFVVHIFSVSCHWRSKSQEGLLTHCSGLWVSINRSRTIRFHWTTGCRFPRRLHCLSCWNSPTCILLRLQFNTNDSMWSFRLLLTDPALVDEVPDLFTRSKMLQRGSNDLLLVREETGSLVATCLYLQQYDFVHRDSLYE